MITSADPSNKYFAEYIKYYNSLENPDYAVLVTGAWGVGKTYQVKAMLPEAYYVSLFGLNSPDDVIYSIYAEMYPTKTKIEGVIKRFSGAVAEILGKGSRGINTLTSGLVDAFFRKEVKPDKPIIFDDLERCGLQPKAILGLINLYVEHHRCRVIAIAHDEKLKKYFFKSKEKLFGKTIRILPEIDAAYKAFTKHVSNPNAKKILKNNKDLIITVFKESDEQSLRVLKHLILDIERFSQCLKDDHLSNSNALSEILMLFSAFNIECRAGRLQKADLANREIALLKYPARQKETENDTSKPGIVRADEKYKDIDVKSVLLDDRSLTEMFVHGVFNPETIRSSLDASPFFSPEHTPRPWRIVIKFQELEDDIVNDGLARMESEFKAREITEDGEMLHVFALKLMMANNDISEKSIDDIARDCCEYIDDLEKMGKLEPGELGWSLQGGAYGLCYWSAKGKKCEAKFNCILKRLISAKKRALEKTFPDKAREILGLMRDDVNKFRERLCHTANAENNLFVSVPVLAAIEPSEFVSAWMNAPKKNWRWIARTLKDRGVESGFPKGQESEQNWFQEVRALLETEACQNQGFARLRIKMAIEQAFEQN